MKIRFLTRVQLIAAGMAEAVSKSTKVEKATQNKATETATAE